MGYGYLHRGRIVEPDAITGGYIVEIPTLAPGGRRMGPFAALVPNLPIGERVVLASLGESRDEMVIIGRVPGASTPIGEIPGLQAALDALTAQDVVLDGRLDVVEPIVSSHTGTLASHTSTLATHTTQIADKVSTTSVGVAGGVASLDGTGKHPSSELNTGVELISRKNAASGYAGLDSSSKLTGSQQVYATSVNDVNNANAAGSANTAARGDHVHRGDLTVYCVQREDDATLGTSASTTRVALHTVALTGLLVNTMYRVQVKVTAYSSVTNDHVRAALYKTSTAGTVLDHSTNTTITIGGGDVHNLLLDYVYKTGAAETSVTIVVAAWREGGTGTATFKAWAGMPYKFQVTQLGLASLNTF